MAVGNNTKYCCSSMVVAQKLVIPVEKLPSHTKAEGLRHVCARYGSYNLWPAMDMNGGFTIGINGGLNYLSFNDKKEDIAGTDLKGSLIGPELNFSLGWAF